jgi:hypothetical protein
MDDSAPIAKPTAVLWKIWIAVVVGPPVVAIVMILLGNNAGAAAANAMIGIGSILGGLSWITHIVVSVMLATRIADKQAPEHGLGSVIGLLAGLILGGWAITLAIAFCGCLAVVAIQH